MLYTDQFLEKIMKKIKNNIINDDWLFIFTADHGQTVSKSTMGHGSLQLESDYLVPTFIISNNKKIKNSYISSFSSCNRIFHQQLSTYIGKNLGFDIKIPDCEKGIVNGSRMDGSAGYLHIEQ
ncbi:MAG: sulfatase-like hydrolase/transferase [Oceanisphaera sp.]